MLQDQQLVSETFLAGAVSQLYYYIDGCGCFREDCPTLVPQALKWRWNQNAGDPKLVEGPT